MPEYDHAHGYGRMTDAQLLAKVKKGWRSEETPCGKGSEIGETALIRRHLPAIADKYGIHTVADAGAGDLHWSKLVKWYVGYFPFDLYPRHPEVTQLDITKDLLPAVDLILCRHVLNHLSIEFAERAVDGFFDSGSRYLLMTTCDQQEHYWGKYNLCVGEPIETFKDCQHWTLELHDLLPSD